ncbi:unnamed protein product [Rotaria socialis]|uniref:Peptidase C1A papain C-terminal domain-containing protein n=1 Tax=Rotaria socialis TaxID=392032 RepID=A0A821N7V7_9BILA|nr:unnamed protein product [Rotaria socialis]CAF4781810.1 unnamed protein product [Rotaria socialis]
MERNTWDPSLTYDEIVRTISNKYTTSLATKISTKSDRQIFRPPSNLSIPATVDWRKRGAVTSIIESQGQCASDWAYTATTALEGQHFLKTGKLVRLSAQNLLDCSGKFGNQGCNGGLVNAAFQYIKANKGVDTEASYPYEAMEGKCRFNRSTVGVYDEPACSTKEWSHTMTIVGYDVFNNGTTKRDYYIVKNSWGETWSLNGYIWMSRNKNNQCGIANWASYPLV